MDGQVALSTVTPYMYGVGLSAGTLLERVDQLLRRKGRRGILEDCQQVCNIFLTQLHRT